MKKYLLICFFLILTVLLVGCQANEQSNGNDENDNDSTVQPDIFTAEDIIYSFQQTGLPIGDVIVYTEETDPNGFLGRPGQYVGKASWEDTRIEQFGDEPTGGTVEVFDSENALAKRKEYLEPFIEQPMFLEYMYIYNNVIVRIDGRGLTPAQAEEYNQALQNAQKAQ